MRGSAAAVSQVGIGRFAAGSIHTAPRLRVAGSEPDPGIPRHEIRTTTHEMKLISTVHNGYTQVRKLPIKANVASSMKVNELVASSKSRC
jgi:hypothetical protein